MSTSQDDDGAKVLCSRASEVRATLYSAAEKEKTCAPDQPVMLIKLEIKFKWLGKPFHRLKIW